MGRKFGGAPPTFWGGGAWSRVVVSVSTSRSRDGLETYQCLVSVSSRRIIVKVSVSAIDVLCPALLMSECWRWRRLRKGKSGRNDVKAKFHYAIWFEAGRSRRPAASWNLAYHPAC